MLNYLSNVDFTSNDKQVIKVVNRNFKNNSDLFDIISTLNKLTPATRLVFRVCLDWANEYQDKNGYFRLSIRAFAYHAQVSESSVTEALKVLQSKKLLKRWPIGGVPLYVVAENILAVTYKMEFGEVKFYSDNQPEIKDNNIYIRETQIDFDAVKPYRWISLEELARKPAFVNPSRHRAASCLRKKELKSFTVVGCHELGDVNMSAQRSSQQRAERTWPAQDKQMEKVMFENHEKPTIVPTHIQNLTWLSHQDQLEIAHIPEGIIVYANNRIKNQKGIENKAAYFKMICNKEFEKRGHSFSKQPSPPSAVASTNSEKHQPSDILGYIKKQLASARYTLTATTDETARANLEKKIAELQDRIAALENKPKESVASSWNKPVEELIAIKRDNLARVEDPKMKEYLSILFDKLLLKYNDDVKSALAPKNES